MSSSIHPTKSSRFYLSDTELALIFENARILASDHAFEFAGTVIPHDAWRLFRAKHAQIVDIRTAEERKFVGFIPGTLHIAWATGMSFQRNPNFIQELTAQLSKDTPILLLCRSGKRSAAAASVAYNAGFHSVYNIHKGFEGDLDQYEQRGSFNGWRYHQLPWKQE